MPHLRSIPEQSFDILERKCFAHVATVRRDGRLSNNPVALIWDGRHVRFSTRKKLVKYRSLREDPRIALSIPDPTNIWRYLEIRGRAELEDDADRAFIDSIARKYMGVDRYPYDLPTDERVTVTVHAEQVSYVHVHMKDLGGQVPASWVEPKRV
jgi:PPOX class probable F420-dependent enzyme